MNIPTPSVIWEEATFGQMILKWTSEPSIDAIKSVVRQKLDLDQTIEVDFFAQGAFNKLYSFKIGDVDHAYVMRVSLPVDPHVKVESEAATIELVRQRTNINVPSVIAFDSSNQNPLGYEWILMKFMKGRVLETAWRAMTWENKEELVRTVARSLAQLFKQSFKGIGNIYFAKGDTGPSSLDATTGGRPNVQSHSPGYDLGELVSMALFWNNRQKYKLYRGPYKGSADWLGALLELQIYESRKKICQLTTEKSNMEQSSLMVDSTSDQDQAEGLASTSDGLPPLLTKPESISGHDDEEEIEDAKSVIRLAEKLIESIPLFFSNASTEEAEETWPK